MHDIENNNKNCSQTSLDKFQGLKCIKDSNKCWYNAAETNLRIQSCELSDCWAVCSQTRSPSDLWFLKLKLIAPVFITINCAWHQIQEECVKPCNMLDPFNKNNKLIKSSQRAICHPDTQTGDSPTDGEVVKIETAVSSTTIWNYLNVISSS